MITIKLPNCWIIFCISMVFSHGKSSLHFFGNGVGDIDRVKIKIDEINDSQPGPPADIGSEDFTMEFWIRSGDQNLANAITCGNNYNWINGNIIVDRDRFNQNRGFGISLGDGRITFGANSDATQSTNRFIYILSIGKIGSNIVYDVRGVNKLDGYILSPDLFY